MSEILQACYKLIKQDGTYDVDFIAGLIRLYLDDTLRLSQPAFPLNKRYWRPDSEADCENWFNSEIANAVLSAWHNYPSLVQTSYIKPILEDGIPENIDCWTMPVDNSSCSLRYGLYRLLVHS